MLRKFYNEHCAPNVIIGSTIAAEDVVYDFEDFQVTILCGVYMKEFEVFS